MTVSRRSLLKLGLAGSAVVAVGGVGLSLRPTTMVSPATPLVCLSEQQFSVTAAVADTLLPPRDGWPRPHELGIAEEIDANLSRCHPGVIREFKQVIGLLESALVGLLVDRRWSTFTGCSPERRARVLESWRLGRSATLQSCYLALNGLVVGPYFSRPEVHAQVGYGGVPEWINELRMAP